MVILITGRAGAGKTTLAWKLKEWIKDSLVIDSEEIREAFKDDDYSDEGRLRHCLRMAQIGALLERQGVVPILALIAPKKSLRMAMREFFDEHQLIYIPGGELWEGTEYEEPDEDETKYGGELYDEDLGNRGTP